MMRLVGAPVALVRSLVAHRFLAAQLARRFFSARHSATSLGWMWTLAATAVQFLLFLVVFSKIIGIRVAGPPGMSFGVYLMSGLVPFLALADAVTRAAAVFPTNAVLVQKVRFPAEVLVVADTAGALGHHALAFGLVTGICYGVVRPPFAAAMWLPLAVAVLVLWAVGLALLAAVAGAFLPDLREVLALAVQVLFYGAPIVYTLELVPVELRPWIAANPVSGIVALVRAALLGLPMPSMAAVAGLVGAGVALVAVGAAALEVTRSKIPDAV